MEAMKKSSRRWVSALLVLVMLLSLLPAGVFAADNEETIHAATISVESVGAAPGSSVQVAVRVTDNPGILGARLEVAFDDGLTLVGAENGEAFSMLTMTKPGKFTSPCRFVWDGQEIADEDVRDGVILTLTFAVAEDAQSGVRQNIHISYKAGDFVDQDMNPLSVNMADGGVDVVDYIPGDVNMDGDVTTTDIIVLRRYLAGGYDVSVRVPACDVNADGQITTSDIIYLRRYLAGGYGIDKLKPSPIIDCEHSLEEIPYKAPTCTEEGNIAYWHCTDCDKYFSDMSGTTELTLDATVLEATGHEEEIIPATDTTTEGKKCSKCGMILLEPQPVEADEYEIRYDISNGIRYIEQLVSDGVIVNPNPLTYKSNNVLVLEDVSVEGYRFLGWFYEREGGSAVESIPAGQTGVIKLFAHWKRMDEENTIIFNYDSNLAGLIDTSVLENVTYSVDTTKKLPILSLPGYTFVGWSDEDGNICTEIKPGSSGEKRFYANWVSDRNKAWAAKTLGDPYVYSDDDVILFAYEIGKIENVPVYEIENFGKIIAGGIQETVTKEVAIETNEQCLKAYTSSVEKATTQNASWTLDSGWTDSISINAEYAKKQGKSVEEIETESKSKSGTWYLNTTTGGGKTTVDSETTDTYDLETTTKNKKTYNSSDSTTYDNKTNLHGYDVNGSLELSKQENAKVGIDGLAEVGVGASQKLTIGGSYENKTTNKTGTDTVKKTGEDSDEGGGTQTGDVTHDTSSTTKSSNWSVEEGESTTEGTSWSKSAATALSEEINTKKGYGSSYIKSENASQTNGLVTADSVKDGFTSQTTYSKVQYEKQTVSYTTGAAITGYHRWVMAATAHVFGVVGYDIAKNSYFVYTYSVLDDDYAKFADYSFCSASYADNQSGVINFEAPDDIVDYVKSKVFQTDGLKFDKDGYVTEYKGTDSVVIIPEYALINNLDGTSHVVKVTGLKPGVFTNNENITAVVLSDFITSVPASEFEGCKNLHEFCASGVTSIGERAFAGCPLLRSITLSEEITELGSYAYDSSQFLEVTAKNYDVIEGAIHSGAKEIVIDLSCFDDTLDNRTLTIPEGTERFTLRAFDKSFENLSIISNAKETKLNRVKINSTGTVPLQINSEMITLYQVSVNASGIALSMLADSVELSLYGAVNVTSAMENAILTDDLTIKGIDGNLDTAMNVTGNLLTCGTVVDTENYLKFISGKVIDGFSKDTLKNMLIPYTLSFDANGGSIADGKDSMAVYYGMPLGALPTPTRANYTFSGWYTQRDGGTPVTSESVFSVTEDMTVYAHWSLNTYVLTFNANGGRCAEQQRTVTLNAAIGELPTPTKDYYTFVGWYTAADGGSAVSAKTTFGNANGTTLYAHWKLNELSGWVLRSEVPEGGEIVNQKWTYDERTNTTSRETSLSGYTQYGSYWVQSSNSTFNYASFPDGFDTSHWIYKQFHKSCDVSAYETETEKREVSTSDVGFVYYKWDYNAPYANNTHRSISHKFRSTGVADNFWYGYFHANLSTKNHPYLDNSYCNNANMASYNCSSEFNTSDTAGPTPRFFRFKYYQASYNDYYKMFKYYKIEAKESPSAVTETDLISNVQSWVQYRAR